MALRSYVDKVGPAVSAADLNQLDLIRNAVLVNNNGILTIAPVTGGNPGTTGITLQQSGAVGLTGTAIADNAPAGSIGEYLTNTVIGGSLTSGTPGNICSLVLTAGDWDVDGSMGFSPAATTNITVLQTGLSLTSAVFTSNYINQQVYAPFVPNATINLLPPTLRVNIAAPTTVYLVAQASFTVSTMGIVYGLIRARRVR